MNIIEDSRYADEEIYVKQNLAYMLEVEEFQIMLKGYFSVSNPHKKIFGFKHGGKVVDLYLININDNNVEDLKMGHIDWYFNEVVKAKLPPECVKWESVRINAYSADKASVEGRKTSIKFYFIEVNEKLIIFHTWLDEDMLPEEKEDIYMIINSFVEKDKANAYKQTFEDYNTPQRIDNLARNFKYKNIVWYIFAYGYFILSMGAPGLIDIFFKQDVLLKNKEYVMFSSPILNMVFELILIVFISASIYGIIVKKILFKLLPTFMFNISKIVQHLASYKNKGIKGEITTLIICLALLFFSFTTYTYIDNQYIYKTGFFDIKPTPKYELGYIKRIKSKLIYSDKELNYYIEVELENGKKLKEDKRLTSIYLKPEDKKWVTEGSRSVEIKLKNKEKIKNIYYWLENVKSVNENVVIQREAEDTVTDEVIEAAKKELKMSKEEEKYLSIYGLYDE